MSIWSSTRHHRLRKLTLAISLAFTCVASFGCEVDEFLDEQTSVARGPERRAPEGSHVRCYESFSKYKAANDRAGDDMQWHHIVGQHPANERKFGKLDLNCTDNVIRIPSSVHQKISGHYSSKTNKSEGKIVRDWQAEKSFDEQYEYGLQLLRENGINYDPR